LLEKLTKLYEARDKTFGNARLVRNLFEKTVEKQANRLAKFSNLEREMMIKIISEDIT
jgi:hypothetical protein